MTRSRSSEFATTQWSLVLAVAEDSPTLASEAMERLCSRYWFPVYASIRRHGNDVHQAEDLTQGFFEFVIRNGVLQRAQTSKGRFRCFILASLQNYLHNQHDRATAQKRGGGCTIIPLDGQLAEEILATEPPSTHSAGNAFDRRWAVALLRGVMASLRNEFSHRGRAAVCDALLPHLSGDPSPGDYDRIASGLSMEPGALRVAMHRLRRRFGELLRSEVACTVTDPAEVEEEIRYLLSVLADE